MVNVKKMNLAQKIGWWLFGATGVWCALGCSGANVKPVVQWASQELMREEQRKRDQQDAMNRAYASADRIIINNGGQSQGWVPGRIYVQNPQPQREIELITCSYYGDFVRDGVVDKATELVGKENYEFSKRGRMVIAGWITGYAQQQTTIEVYDPRGEKIISPPPLPIDRHNFVGLWGTGDTLESKDMMPLLAPHGVGTYVVKLIVGGEVRVKQVKIIE